MCPFAVTVVVQDGLVPALVNLGGVPNDEVQQDVARCLANLASNEENHVPLYQQEALKRLVALTDSADDVTQRCVCEGYWEEGCGGVWRKGGGRGEGTGDGQLVVAYDCPLPPPPSPIASIV